MLIFAGLCICRGTASKDEISSSVISQVPERGSGVPQAISRDVLLLAVYRRSVRDKPMMICSQSSMAQQGITNVPVTIGEIDRISDEFGFHIFAATAKSTSFCTTPKSVQREIAIAVQTWQRQPLRAFHIYLRETMTTYIHSNRARKLTLRRGRSLRNGRGRCAARTSDVLHAQVQTEFCQCRKCSS